MTGTERENPEVSAETFLTACLQKWWVIVIWVLAAALVAGLVSGLLIAPRYEARASIYVSTAEDGGLSSSVFNASSKLADTYIALLDSDTLLKKAAAAAGVTLPPDVLREMIATAPVNDTGLFYITVSHKDPDTAARIANGVAEVVPREIPAFVAGSTAQIVDLAAVPEEPVSPDLLKNCVLGGLAGAVLSLVWLGFRLLAAQKRKD